jgi:predicted exporter
MLMTPPRSPREWAVGLISTVLGSICGGAAVVQHFGMQSWLASYVGLVALLGLAFACGLPAWAIVRWGFTWMIKRQDKDLGEIAAELKALKP